MRSRWPRPGSVTRWPRRKVRRVVLPARAVRTQGAHTAPMTTSSRAKSTVGDELASVGTNQSSDSRGDSEGDRHEQEHQGVHPDHRRRDQGRDHDQSKCAFISVGAAS